MGGKYPIDYDSMDFQQGNGVDFVPARAGLDGDWVCQFLRIPFDRYYMDYVFQRESLDRARAMVDEEMGLQLVGDKVYDHGVILNASLFGGAVQYHDNSTPVLAPVIGDPSDVPALAARIDSLSDEGLMHEGALHQEYWRAAQTRGKQDDIDPRAPASGGTKGIATVCGQLCTVTNFLTWLYTNPAEMMELTTLVGRTFSRYIGACREFDGCEDNDGLGFASDLAGLMSPDTYGAFCAPGEKELYDRYAPNGTRFYHADSNMRNHVGILRDIGVTDVNIGPMVSVTDILSAVPEMVVHGQIPPTQVLWQGTPDLVVDAVRRDIEEIRSAGASLSQLQVCTAGSINPGTPLENIRAMFWAASAYGRFDGEVRSDLAAIPIDFDRRTTVDQVS
jgi:uroporphyrinogen-III decarboxylase